MYTVTFKDMEGQEQVSRFFETLKAARRWSKWLANKQWCKGVKIYRGQAGEQLIENY